MDSTPPGAVANPHKSQRGWLMAFGVVEILMGGAFLLMIVFSAIVFLGHAGATGPPAAMSPVALVIFAALQYGVMAAVFVTGGIGSIRCRNWARIMMLVVSGFWLVFGLAGTLIMAFIVPSVIRAQHGSIPSAIGHIVVVVMIAVSTFMGVILPAIFLFFYSRASVRATCLAQEGAQLAVPGAGETAPSALPVPLAILGALEAFGSLFVLAMVFVMPVTVMFGVVLRGRAALAIFLTYSILGGYAAWMIFRKKLIGWHIALFTAGLGLVSMLVTYLRRPDMLQLFQEVGNNNQPVSVYELFPQFLPLVWLAMIVMMVVMIAFIIYTKQFFPKEG